MGLRVAKFRQLWNVEEQYKGKPYQGLFFLFKLQRPLNRIFGCIFITSLPHLVFLTKFISDLIFNCLCLCPSCTYISDIKCLGIISLPPHGLPDLSPQNLASIYSNPQRSLRMCFRLLGERQSFKIALYSILTGFLSGQSRILGENSYLTKSFLGIIFLRFYVGSFI